MQHYEPTCFLARLRHPGDDWENVVAKLEFLINFFPRLDSHTCPASHVAVLFMQIANKKGLLLFLLIGVKVQGPEKKSLIYII